MSLVFRKTTIGKVTCACQMIFYWRIWKNLASTRRNGYELTIFQSCHSFAVDTEIRWSNVVGHIDIENKPHHKQTVQLRWYRWSTGGREVVQAKTWYRFFPPRPPLPHDLLRTRYLGPREPGTALVCSSLSPRAGHEEGQESQNRTVGKNRVFVLTKICPNFQCRGSLKALSKLHNSDKKSIF